jgi:hypothetical protein
MRILVTGSRNWTNPRAVEAALSAVWLHFYVRGASAQPVVVHGAARGADTLAAQAAVQFGFDVEAHHANWQQFGRAAGPRRNAEMVALGADICLAFPLGASPGTRGCMALARTAGIPVVDASRVWPA